ncbi:MAG: hypothetical protein ABIJ41_08245 [Candidatus Omnitrophota bacterium]
MIVPMKKIHLIVQKKDAQGAIGVLQEAGIVHIEHQGVPSSGEVQQLTQDIERLTKALEILPRRHPDDTVGMSRGSDFRRRRNVGTFNTHVPAQSIDENQAAKVAQEIIHLCERTHQLKDEIAHGQMTISEWEPWGNFDPDDIQRLVNQGVCLQLCQVPVKELEKLPEDIALEVLFVKAGLIYGVLVSRNMFDIPDEFMAKVLSLPSMSLHQMKAKKQKLESELSDINDQIRKLVCHEKALRRTYQDKLLALRYHEALAGMKKEESLTCLKGFCPQGRCHQLQALADRQKWALLIQDPLDDDSVPTFLKNPRWVEMIKPVFSLMNILPGYREVDISLLFLLFFSVFFGMLIGDAGYGAIFLIMTFLGQKKWSKHIQNPALFVLMYVLGIFTVVWGVFTGTFFGQIWLPSSVQPLFPGLRNNENIQALCFLIGGIHLSIAHIWRGLMKMPSLAALAEIGWLSLLWGMFFLAKFLILSHPFPSFGLGLIITGPILVIFFSQPKKNMMKTISLGLGDFLVNLTNTFTDLVSYIRLFAVGLASVAVADAFNQIAMDMGMNTLWTSLVAALVLVFGHLLNIVLGLMAVLVHGVRLNVLEFSSHLKMEWTGFKYDPLRRTDDINL